MKYHIFIENGLFLSHFCVTTTDERRRIRQLHYFFDCYKLIKLMGVARIVQSTRKSYDCL
jgi:hypothetical protein